MPIFNPFSVLFTDPTFFMQRTFVESNIFYAKGFFFEKYVSIRPKSESSIDKSKSTFLFKKGFIKLSIGRAGWSSIIPT